MNNQPPSESQDSNLPTPGKSHRRNFLKHIIAGGATLAGGGITALNTPQLQRMLIYSPTKDFAGNDLPPLKEPAAYGLDTLKAVELTTASGHTFTAWQSKTLNPDQKTFVFFPGNAGHLGHSPETGPGGIELGDSDGYIRILKEAIHQGYQIIAANPVGYAGSNLAGSPTQRAMYEGAEATIEHAVSHKIQPRNIHISGLSMGTALATHAAHHLMHDASFKNDPSQSIHLTLANGLVNVRSGLEELAPLPNSVVFKVWDNLDETAELSAMAAQAGKRVNVAFIRGEKDEATPESQVQAHRLAAKGLNFRSETVAGEKHYIHPKDLLRQFDEMSQGHFEQQALSR